MRLACPAPCPLETPTQAALCEALLQRFNMLLKLHAQQPAAAPEPEPEPEPEPAAEGEAAKTAGPLRAAAEALAELSRWMDLSSSADDGKWLRATLDLDRASGRPATALAALSKIAAPDGGAPKAELLQLRCELLREMGAGRAPPPPAPPPARLCAWAPPHRTSAERALAPSPHGHGRRRVRVPASVCPCADLADAEAKLKPIRFPKGFACL